MGDLTLFHNGRIHTLEGVVANGWLLVDEGQIVALGEGAPPASHRQRAEPIDLGGAWLLPGLIDMHTHGALGCDTMDADPEALRTMARFFAQHGVTGFLATTMSAPAPAIHAALHAVRDLMEADTGGAALLGAHVEGPYLDEARRGAQEARFVRAASADEYPDLFDTGVVRLLTLAPEVAGGHALIRYARERGAAVSIGHTRADYDAMRLAVDLGASQVTHLFNGMEPLHHREPGAVGAALVLDGLTCELIADLIHLHPAVLRLAYRCKGPERLALVTDAMAGTGMPDGDYALGGAHVAVREGVARDKDGALAGSTLTLDRAVANMMQATDEPLEHVLPMATRVPARCLGLPAKGDIALGRDADLVVMGETLQVRMTMVRGQIVHQS
jgi:N-acetylglucosamine-6-phosphate deacetylase